MLKIVIYVFLLIFGQVALCQIDNFRFIEKVEKGNYSLLQGTIDRKYNITMKLFVNDYARCGEEGLAIQWKNGGIDGWYEYDKIGKKIDLTGSYLYNEEVRLYVPSSPNDTINQFTCEMENFNEIFWNNEDFDLTHMKWKMKGGEEPKIVELKELHEPSQDTMYVILERGNNEEMVINISELIDLPGIDNIEIISYSNSGNYYHLLFELENNGRREYQKYLGYLSINEELEIKDFEVLLYYDSWKGEIENLIYNERCPEKGIKKR